MLHKEEKRALGQLIIILLVVSIAWVIVPAKIVPEPTPITALLAPNSLGVLLALPLGAMLRLFLGFAVGFAGIIMMLHSLKNAVWPLWKSGVNDIKKLICN